MAHRETDLPELPKMNEQVAGYTILLLFATTWLASATEKPWLPADTKNGGACDLDSNGNGGPKYLWGTSYRPSSESSPVLLAECMAADVSGERSHHLMSRHSAFGQLEEGDWDDPETNRNHIWKWNSSVCGKVFILNPGIKNHRYRWW
jgi:hypothetical protein